jgi:pyruvate/2-oxoglutarate dehydrogenase complex dihydrolipoamide acyltransferase (E2) component
VHLGLTADHRVWDAYESGRFLDAVEAQLASTAVAE